MSVAPDRWWGCERKRAYLSRAQARVAAREVTLKTGARHRAYRCRFEPSHYHIAHARPAERIA